MVYLHDLPAQILKIDKLFVEGLPADRRDVAVITATIQLAHSLGMRVVVEGVETGEQLALLRELGSDFAQGYFLGHPVPAAEVVLGKPLVRIDSVTQGRLLEPLLRTRTCKQRGQ